MTFDPSLRQASEPHRGPQLQSQREQRGESLRSHLPAPRTPVPNLPLIPPQWGASFCPIPIVREGRARGGLRAGAPRGRCPAHFRRDSTRDATSPPLRVSQSHFGSAWRPELRSAPPAAALAPARPPGSQAPGNSAGSLRPRPTSGRWAGVPVPHTCVPLPEPRRFQGPRRRPLPGPRGPPPPSRAAPSSSSCRGRRLYLTITPVHSCPHPQGHQCQRQLPQPRTYLHGSTKPRSGGGESSALLWRSLALQGLIVSAIG